MVANDQRILFEDPGSGLVRAIVEITDLNLPGKSATLRIGCMVKEDVVIDGEAIVPVPARD